MSETQTSGSVDPALGVPESELEYFAGRALAFPEYFDPPTVQRLYRDVGLEVVGDAFGRDVPDRVAGALAARRSMSVVRIGDAEANILCFGVDRNTPWLDRFCVDIYHTQRPDTFLADDAWHVALRELMMGAVLKADIVGVIGLWRWGKVEVRPTGAVDRLREDPRGRAGHWRSIDRMLWMARRGFLDGKLMAPAHLYFSVLEHMDVMVEAAERLVLFTSEAAAVSGLKARYPDRRVDGIVEGAGAPRGPRPASPDFLQRFERTLPDDLSGCLYLIGAGPWAKIYCGWVKERGGVAVDVGSGFDLLSGRELTRPVHRALGLDKANRYAL